MIPSDSELPFTFKRIQFPIQPCFAMAINKSQGQSFKRVAVFLPQPLFTHGQLYVAASRVGDPKNIHFYVNQDPYKQKYQNHQQSYTETPFDEFRSNKVFTTDIVYNEAL